MASAQDHQHQHPEVTSAYHQQLLGSPHVVIETTDTSGITSLVDQAQETTDPDPPILVEPKKRGGNILATRWHWPWGLTNFHVSLIIGITLFVIFWIILLLRIYLPAELFGRKGKAKRRP